MSVSGTDMVPRLLLGKLDGPRLLTGGAFGPEASVVAVMVCLAASAFFLWRIVRGGLTEAPAWRRSVSATSTDSDSTL
jgi:uncharacterized protein